MIKASEPLTKLRQSFKDRGFDLWFVGGCVRDTLLDLEPKDIDLCTDATPDEALLIYKENDLKYIETGIQHGTITVMLKDGDEILGGGDSTLCSHGGTCNDNFREFDGSFCANIRRLSSAYEITSLRTESDHDGRRATVAYTRDLKEDLSRRDLTINAIAQDFDGNIIDPFGGAEDLNNCLIRFVGNPEERMKEDYLRILRFFRFHGRFGRGTPLDTEAVTAIGETKDGLSQISGERIWLEMSKILVGPQCGYIIQRMKQEGVLTAIGMPRINMFGMAECSIKKLSRPSTVLGLIFTSIDELNVVMEKWKLSTSERAEARFANRMNSKTKLRDYKDALVDKAPIDWVEEMLKLNDLPSLRHWDIPVFPVNGADLIERGIEPGPKLGFQLAQLFLKWRESRYTLKKSELLN